MMQSRRSALALVLCLLATTRGAHAQSSSTASLSGKVVHPNNVTHPGERVLLYDYAGRRWIGPALTDDYGEYAFYGIAPGAYLLSLYANGKPVWSTKVTITSSPSSYNIQAPS